MAETIAPFYEAGPPPPAYPLLTLQTDLAYLSLPTATITATEDVIAGQHPTVLPIRTPLSITASSAGPSRTPITRSRSSTPYPSAKPSRMPRSRSRSSSPYPLAKPAKRVDFVSDVSDGDDDALSVDSEDGCQLIPKPQGQAGRPNRGGYNLEVALNWPPKIFAKLQKYIHQLVDMHLDITQSYQPQKESARQLVRNTAIDAFPQLIEYENYWPVNDIMMLYLKNTARREKLKVQKLTLEAKKRDKGKTKEDRGKGKERENLSDVDL